MGLSIEQTMDKEKQWKTKVIKLIVLCIVSAGLALGIAIFFTARLWDVTNIKNNLINLRMWTTFHRAYIMFFILFYIGLHFIIQIKKMYNWMFEKRWILGIGVLLFLTVNRYHGDSIGYYDDAIQPNISTESSNPIVGETRGIRSDEFVVTTPAIFASSYGETAYSKYSDIMRGTGTLNIINGIYTGYATLGYAPQELVYGILPAEYAFSFCWWFPLIFGFLMSIELFLIISNRKRLLSVAGAFLIVFSSFYLWWGFSMYFVSAPGTIVCLYHFLQDKDRWKKILFGIGIAICFSVFVTNLYPAWQVPLGYMFLAIGIWILHENWDKIKKLRKSDWVIIGCSVVFMISLILSYLSSVSEYVEAITQTLYPGERIETGGFGLQKLFYYAQAPFYAYKDIGNPCEVGVFFSLFPIPTIVAAYCWIKEKKKDWLTGGLLLAQIPMLIYTTIGFPEVVAKLLLFSNSVVMRTVDIIGLMQIYFIVILLSRYDNVKKMSLKIAIPLGVLVTLLSIYVSNHFYADYLALYQKIVMFVLILGLCIGIMIQMSQKGKQILMFVFIGISLFTGIYIRPLMKGFDAIYAKPVASEIQKICSEEPDTKWLTNGGGIVLSGFSVACGASTVNSVNTYPNLELWEELDVNSRYANIYNRYAHVSVEFTNDDTSFDLLYADHMRVNLSYKDIQLTKAEYLLTMGEPNIDMNNSYVKFEKVYSESGMSIYHMIY